MSVKVFVSSTKDDLDPDCRPRVLEAVAIAQAVAVAMENWPAEYLPALDLVKRKIDESTHYLGLFAYRRGWTPPGSRVSITEAEFDYATARLNGERVTVFVPTEDSEIAAVLRQRAEQAQDLADADAQTRFLERVLAAGAVEPFATVPDLSSRATRRVIFWNTPLLEQELRRANQARGTSNPHEVAALGRQAQVDCFAAEVLGRLAAAGGGTPAAGVLVSGPAGHGHPQLLARLRRLFEQVSRRTHPCTIGCGPLWRTGGLQSLLRVLARETGAP
ncbi:MAG TPA: DUF4062 domain-containing protein, partial [Longimicrobium sp.]|nr:DUF4062 domain-containing protein [Longimicrobium sp.]